MILHLNITHLLHTPFYFKRGDKGDDDDEEDAAPNNNAGDNEHAGNDKGSDDEEDAASNNNAGDDEDADKDADGDEDKKTGGAGPTVKQKAFLCLFVSTVPS